MRVFASTLAFALLLGCSKKEAVKVPDTFHVKFITSEGDFTVEANKAWAPHAVDRFHELLRMKYFDEGRFFRVVPKYIAQFGVHKDYATHAIWRELFFADDKRQLSNTRGTLTFAQNGPNTRATEIFINLKDNPMLDEEGFVPFAKVAEGMEIVDRFYSGYGELRPTGRYIEPGRLEEGGNSYLVPRFPALDFIKKTEILP
ncbi:MAG: peptidylprolyl isomerase [Acidobacteriota bacterium]